MKANRLTGYFVSVLCLLSSVFCLGRATPPEQVKLTQAQNEVLGKFARQVGEKELNILLRDPNDTTLPGIPIGDLLYILSRVHEDKLIRLVKGIGAQTTLELILAIKRVGCTRANTVPVASGYGFDARSVPSLNGCTWQHLHIPNLMVQLLNGVTDQGLQVLIDAIRHNYPEYGLPANQALQISCPNATCPSLHVPPYLVTVDHYRYLMKLAYIVVAFDTPTTADPNLSGENLSGPKKLYDLLNLTHDGRDMVFLLDSFDRNNCPVAPATNSNCVYVDAANNLTTYDPTGDLWQDIEVNDYQMQGLQNLLQILRDVTDTSKMGVLINGRRNPNPPSIAARLADDEAQIRYFIDRLRVVVERTTTCTAASYPGTAAERALQDFANPQGGITNWNAKLVELINRINNINRMMDLLYNIDDGYDLAHGVYSTCPNRGIDNLMVLLNNLNNIAPHNPPNTTNNEIITAAHLIDNVALDPLNPNPAKRNKVRYLTEFIGNTLDVLKLACYSAVADQADGVPPSDATPEVCDNRGLINLVADGSKLDDSSNTDLTAAGQKLVNLTGQINDVEDMRFLVRKVSMSNMTQIIAGLQISATANVANLINQITGDDCWDENQGIISITVTAPGSYTSPPVITGFSGGGSSASARAVIETDSINFASTVGHVKSVVILNSGSGYTYPAGGTVTFGSGAATATYKSGHCRFNPTTAYRGLPTANATGATGLGKLVNVINHITGSPGTIVTLVNGVTDGTKLGLLINGVSRSSNLVGVMNAVVDTSRNNNANINDLIALLNNLSREDILKMVHLLENLGDAREVDAQVTVPSIDHDMVAQLMAPYNPLAISTNSGIGTAALTEFIALLRYNGGNDVSPGSLSISGGGGSGAAASFATTSP
ncbi:MAG: hypothetical protein N2Z22_00380, partial [Turneriella sp.]|nr:hypothetical protein [Turneriella sp.]